MNNKKLWQDVDEAIKKIPQNGYAKPIETEDDKDEIIASLRAENGQLLDVNSGYVRLFADINAENERLRKTVGEARKTILSLPHKMPDMGDRLPSDNNVVEIVGIGAIQSAINWLADHPETGKEKFKDIPAEQDIPDSYYIPEEEK